MEISSSENQKYKGWQRLLRRKYRDEEGLFLLEGPLLIRDALESGGVVRELILNAREDDQKALEQILEGNPCQASEQTFEIHRLASELFSKLCQTETPRNVLAVVSKPIWDMDMGQGDLWLILDRIQDPGNAGTLIRTAEAAGAAGLITLKGTVDMFSPKVVRAAAGSIIRMPILTTDGTEELGEIKTKKGLTFYAADGSGGSTIWEEDFSRPMGLIIGNEGGGISPELEPLIDEWIKIPMEGAIESLNAGVAGAVIMYEIVRRRNLE